MTVGWSLVALGGAAALVIVGPAGASPVTLPLAVAMFVASVFLGSLDTRPGRAPVEVGVLYVATVFLYLAFPLASYLSNGMTYTSSNESRLYTALPDPNSIGKIAWLYVLHISCFAIVYRLARGNVEFRPAIPRQARARLLLLVGLLGAVFAFFWVLARSYDLSAESYLESYTVAARLPLVVAQISNHVGGMRLPLELVLLVALFSDYRRRWTLVAGLVTVLGVATFTALGSRTEFVLVAGGSLIAYHWFVRPVSVRVLTAGGAVVVALFLAAGALRARASRGAEGVAWNPLENATEFESLFANAFHLDGARRSGELERTPPGLPVSDVLALVPQQLLPVPKVSPSTWYVHEFFPEAAERGAGLAFGTISESIVGAGIPDLVTRAALLGAALAVLHRWAAARSRRFWPVAVYFWVAVNVYQSFRGTTFYPATLFLYRVLPVIAVVVVLEMVARTRRIASLKPTPNEAPPQTDET